MPHTSPENAPTAKRVLNLKAVAIVAGSFVLLWVATGWLHASQVVRTSNFLRSSAEEALAAEDPHRAFDLFEQYLVLNPSDIKAEEQISLLLEEHGTSAKALLRAFHINERLLGKDKSRNDLRLRQIRLSAKLGRYSDAAVHLKSLRDKDTELSEVWHYSGIVARDTGDFANARTYFSKAVSLQNPLPESFENLAQILTNEVDDVDAAENVLRRLVAEHDSADARRIRAAWLLDQNRAAEALPDLWVAVEATPDDIRTNAMILKAIRVAHNADRSFDSKSEYRHVIRHLNAILETKPDLPRLRMYLASALWAVGEKGTAVDQLQYGIERDPRQFEMHEVLVDYLVSIKDYDRARKIFNGIPERVLERGRRSFMEGRLLMAQKQWEPAIELFELALGYAREDQNIASRARICLALCRRESGDNIAAMDTYRSLIQSNPDFEGGRLGIASAYLRANQTALAIAEYRQLMHVEGVPEFLANLMIRHIMAQPPQSRDWSDVEEMLRNEQPLIADEVQRILLQADLLFAKGLPSVAMDTLDRAARKMPDRPEIQRALQRLSSIHGDALDQRIVKSLAENPRNQQAHMSVLRLQIARRDTKDMVAWLTRLLNGDVLPPLSNNERLAIVAETGTQVAELEIATRGASEQTKTLLQFANRAWRQLATQSPQRKLSYTRFLVRHDSIQNAVSFVQSTAGQTSDRIQSLQWLECLRNHQNNAGVRNRVSNELVRLIEADPSNVDLRLAWTDALLLVGDYRGAQEMLTELLEFDTRSGRTQSRLAWIHALIHRNSQQALEFSQAATLKTPGDPEIRSVRGLALAESGQFKSALEVLLAIPDDERTTATELYHARTLFLSERRSEASDLVLDLLPRKADLAPAEVNLLTFLQRELSIGPRLSRR